MTADEIYKLFGQRLGAARISRDMTQAQLGKLIGLSRASVANIEAGRQRILLHQLIFMAGALKLRSPSELIPANLALGNVIGPSSEVHVSGSKVSLAQRLDVARVFDAFEDIEG